MGSRWARAEEKAARKLGTARIHRERGESAGDLHLVRTSSGAVLQPEVKLRKRLPALVLRALEQARSYAHGAIPVAVLFEHGQRNGIACLPLDALAVLLGVDVDKLPAPRPLPRPRPSMQLTFPGVA